MKTTDSCKGEQIPKAEDTAAIFESEPVKSLKQTTWDEWFDGEKCSPDFMLSREQS
ncbi:hypothetical protein JFT91_07560 [Pseudomonas sp. TH08]|uniref:hypothetical protein n=1 Tax=unclassified Pseudomonas TaxID=196821 RepID=UPI00191288CC|nr:MULTISPECIES: hypothetical protein [unclassified Pseudomonas]MBK5526271.1 hypothetical protein [Pseudomonas sp. TH06]MBK5532464.1 hypothetical protein [Pseudomonas sp. TH08]